LGLDEDKSIVTLLDQRAVERLRQRRVVESDREIFRPSSLSFFYAAPNSTSPVLVGLTIR